MKRLRLRGPTLIVLAILIGGVCASIPDFWPRPWSSTADYWYFVLMMMGAIGGMSGLAITAVDHVR